MKKGLRFIAAVLILASLGIWFLPIVEADVVGVRVSIVDVFKVGIGYYNKESLEAISYASIQPFIEPYVWYIAGAAGFVVVEAILSAVLRKRAAYITSMIISVINIGAYAALFFILKEKFGEVEKVLIQFSADEMIKLSYLTLYAWIAIYALVFILSMIGIILWRKPRETDSEDIYLEQISRVEAQRAQRRSAKKPQDNYQEEARSQRPNQRQSAQAAYREQPVQPQMPEQPYTDRKPSGIRQEEMRREQDPSVWGPSQKRSTGSASGQLRTGAARTPEVKPEASSEFTGAVSGESGLYAGRIYSLKDKKEVFFTMNEKNAVLSPYEEEGAAAGIYYIKEYGEYCAEPFEKNTVFLESGQPLGKGRQYYLRRGTKIYIGDRDNSFTLV